MGIQATQGLSVCPTLSSGPLACVRLILDFSLWHTPRAGTGCLVTNCKSTRCFLSPEGSNSSRDAEVRFLTNSELKTDNRETARSHTAFFRGNEKNTLSCSSPEKAPSGSATSSCLRLTRGEVKGTRCVLAWVCARTCLARRTGGCFSRHTGSWNVTTESKMYVA